MTLEKEDLSKAKLKYLMLDDKIYPFIGEGSEGTVYRYDSQIAFKIFHEFESLHKKSQKFKKLEMLANLQDESFCFPIGLIGYSNGQKEGYYTRLVEYNPKLKDFSKLMFLSDKTRVLEYLIKADEAMQRIHQKRVILGDIKGLNIMIDQNDNPIFVDTDNYAYGDYDFDVIDYKTRWLYQIFHKSFSDIDNDIYIFSIMALELLISDPYIGLMQSKAYLQFLIENMNVDNEIKEGLREIFSDAENKPYIGPILRKVKPNERILSKTSSHRINRIFY